MWQRAATIFLFIYLYYIYILLYLYIFILLYQFLTCYLPKIEPNEKLRSKIGR